MENRRGCEARIESKVCLLNKNFTQFMTNLPQSQVPRMLPE